MAQRPSNLLLSLLLASIATFGCHAQQPAPGSAVPPDVARRVEVLLRQKANLPPGATVQVGTRSPSTIPGFDEISVSVSDMEGKSSHPLTFLLSTDGKTLAQFNKFDISADPKKLVSAENRPSRGGAASAPVLIVGFDDLECPYCARLHTQLFPAITERYKDQVRIVYRDFPLDQHPWAMRAAVDVNCLAAQSPAGYWNAVDYIHAHAGDVGKPVAGADGKAGEPTLEEANKQLDKVTREQGTVQKVDMPKLDACIAKQDTVAIKESVKLGTTLNVDSTPSLFINGDKIDGALPNAFIFKIIDQALVAEGKTPPPPYVELPATPAAK
jgi:protein-disulfide isomerase